MLFGAALGAGWVWLAVVMAGNVALSLFYYVRVLEPLYLRAPAGNVNMHFVPEPMTLRISLFVLGVGTLVSGVLPQVWVALAVHASALLLGGSAH